jgi:hypothetical protein
MKAWRIELRSTAGGRLGWPGAIGRFLLGAGIASLALAGAWYLRKPAGILPAAGAIALIAPLLVNFAWIPYEGAGRSLLDLAGGTRVVRKE